MVKKLTATAINSYRADLSTLFAELQKDRIITENHFESMDTKKSALLKHKAFNRSQFIRIKSHLFANDLSRYHFILILIFILYK